MALGQRLRNSAERSAPVALKPSGRPSAYTHRQPHTQPPTVAGGNLTSWTIAGGAPITIALHRVGVPDVQPGLIH